MLYYCAFPCLMCNSLPGKQPAHYGWVVGGVHRYGWGHQGLTVGRGSRPLVNLDV